MMDDLPQPINKVPSGRRRAAHAAQIEMRVSIYETRQNGGVAEIVIGPARTPRLDRDNALALNHEDAVFPRRAGDRKNPAGG